jgi:rRNA maturation RNase YbeY
MKTNIYFCCEDVNYVLASKRKIRFWLSLVLEQEKKKTGNISYIFCSDDYLLKLNNQYLNASYLTDVITFDYTEKNLVSGDVFISVERVKENAKSYKQTCFQEMLRVMLHGILHLCGYKDKTEKETAAMRKKEDYYLRKFDIIKQI